MTEAIARKWLENSARTANQKNHTEHMNLISKNVSLKGVPGYENINYTDWSAQTKHEFNDDILKGVSYKGFKIITTSPEQITFKTFETVEANDGTVNAQGIEITLQKEDDGTWRLTQERILPTEEARQDGLIS